jgi:hypothetical protein
VSTVKKSTAIMLLACVRRNSYHDGPRRTVGPSPSARRIFLTVVADHHADALQLADDPLVAPPRILPGKPHDHARTSAVIAGRPGGRVWVHRCATKSRCHRRSVAGVTTNAAQWMRGNSRLAADRNTRSAGRNAAAGPGGAVLPTGGGGRRSQGLSTRSTGTLGTAAAGRVAARRRERRESPGPSTTRREAGYFKQIELMHPARRQPRCPRATPAGHAA